MHKTERSAVVTETEKRDYSAGGRDGLCDSIGVSGSYWNEE